LIQEFFPFGFNLTTTALLVC